MRKILVVDDDMDIAKLYKRVLQGKGYETYCVYSPDEALSLIDEHHLLPDHNFDLLITDFDMPVMNGVQLATNVRERYPAIKIFLVSGNVHDNLPEILFDQVHKKPIDFPTLCDGIAEALID